MTKWLGNGGSDLCYEAENHTLAKHHPQAPLHRLMCSANDIPPVLFLSPIIVILLRLHFVKAGDEWQTLSPLSAPINLIKLAAKRFLPAQGISQGLEQGNWGALSRESWTSSP